MLVDTKVVQEKIRDADDLRKFMGKPYTWPLRPYKKEDRRHGPRRIVEPGRLSKVEEIARTKKLGLICTDRWYRPATFLKTAYGKHKSQFPLRLHPAAEVRGGEGFTGFPSDIWALACLFGEIRTQRAFLRSPADYGTPVTREEIKRYIASDARIPIVRYYEDLFGDGPQNSSDGDGDESDESSNSVVSEKTSDEPDTRLNDKSDVLNNKSSPSDEPSEKPQHSPKQDVASSEMKETNTENSSHPTKSESKRKSVEAAQDPEKKVRKDEAAGQNEMAQSEEPLLSEVPALSEEPSLSEESSLTGLSVEKPQAHLAKSDAPIAEPEKALKEGKTTPTISSIVDVAQEKEHRTDRLPPEKVRFSGYEHRMPEDEVSILGDLLEKMFAPNPQDRITIEEVLKHEWFGDRRAGLVPPPSPAK